MRHKLNHKLATEVWAIKPDYHAALASAYNDAPVDTEARTPEQIDNVGIIHVTGALGKNLTAYERMLGMTDYDDVALQLVEAEGNPNIDAVILRIDSPGGTITGLPELAARVREVSKPLVAYTQGTAASAAYWLASQCDHVLLSESAEVGSVGVYIALLDQSEHLRMQGLKVEAVSAGEHKLDYADHKPLSDDARQALKDNVDKWHARFKSDVNIKRSAPAASMEGQCFEGMEGISSGLADGVVNELTGVIALVGKM